MNEQAAVAAITAIRKAVHRFLVVAGAVTITASFFFVLPLIQAISEPPASDLVLQSMDVTNLPPPPPPIEEEPEEEEPEEEPPELMEETEPLDLSMLELALNPGGFSESWMGGDFTMNLGKVMTSKKDVEALFSVADLDQRPRIVYQCQPVITAKVRKKTPGKVYVYFKVDKTGKVASADARNATDPVFEKPAVDAVRKWKFEPGKKNGKVVGFKMKVPITFPKKG